MKRRTVLAVVYAIPIALLGLYLFSAADALVSKGWDDLRARQIADALASAVRDRPYVRVNAAQQFADVCSSLTLERYRRSCFTIHIGLKHTVSQDEKSLIVAQLCRQLAEQLKSIYPSDVKASLKFFVFKEELMSDGTRRVNKQVIHTCVEEVR
jgi:hypothetical protein